MDDKTQKQLQKAIKDIEENFLHCVAETKGDMFSGKVCGYYKWLSLPICSSFKKTPEAKYWKKLRELAGLPEISERMTSEKRCIPKCHFKK